MGWWGAWGVTFLGRFDGWCGRGTVRGVMYYARLFRPLSVVRGVRWYLLTTEIPPAGAPLGAGFAVRQWLVGALDFW